jgi:hypothetical protein
MTARLIAYETKEDWRLDARRPLRVHHYLFDEARKPRDAHGDGIVRTCPRQQEWPDA